MLQENRKFLLLIFTANRLTPTAKAFTLESDVLVKNADNNYSMKTFTPEKTEISGVVNNNIAVGAEIEVKVGSYTTTTVVRDDRTFTVEVDSSHLKNNPAHIVTAKLVNSGADVVMDKEYYIAPKAVSGNFVSQHSEVPVAARKMDHTQDDYNFFYPIHLLETETTKRGALKDYAVGGTETPLTIKYHFLRNDEVASLPAGSQGARNRESAAGSIKEATETMKQMFRYAYNKIAEYTNIKFEEVGSWQEANGNNSDMRTGTDGTLIYVGNLNGGQYNGASAIGFQGGNIIWNEAVSSATPAYNDFNTYTAIHEILHTLNLRHAHDAFSGIRTLGAAICLNLLPKIIFLRHPQSSLICLIGVRMVCLSVCVIYAYMI
ncbi:hypothetical protein [Mannheimia varigena]|uniref:hypothetical protein n=1 Tax=Mannheimia varigena TaxID=85404 RepID=UPI001F3647B2|nr:hypothetical protein [Mannheimia varigena]